MRSSKTGLPPSPIAGIRTVELTAEWEPRLQQFFEQNPEYFVSVCGEPAAAGDAHEEIHDTPPAGWSFTKKWLIGWVEPDDSLIAMANVIEDLLVEGVWHIGLFILATARHGSGEAQTLLAGLQAWATGNGARWLRLGVVKGNARAERFWEALGFQDARIREGVEMKQRTNSIRVMFKPLAGGTRGEYLALVERDRPS